MCGILIHHKGISPNFDIDHRGLYTNSKTEGDWILKHRLLPLQTNEESGKQPVPIGKNKYLLFNGEIFNFYKFGNYESDIEYLSSFFKNPDWENNKTEINKWCGFWAIVIYEEEGFTAFTDPLGKKQLYYTKWGISSEIKPLLLEQSILNLPKKIENRNTTPFSGIYRIQPNRIYRILYKRNALFQNEAKTYKPGYKTIITRIYK